MTETCQMLISRLASDEYGLSRLMFGLVDLRMLMEVEHVIDKNQAALSSKQPLVLSKPYWLKEIEYPLGCPCEEAIEDPWDKEAGESM